MENIGYNFFIISCHLYNKNFLTLGDKCLGDKCFKSFEVGGTKTGD